MSKLTTAAATGQQLSLAAAEEASRTGENIGDIEHLLLALTIDGHFAGATLRASGVTIERAREAVAAQHAEQLASLGVPDAATGPGRITFHETAGPFTWNQRTLELLHRASQGDKLGDADAVLRELLAEQSGFIAAVLHRLDTTPEELRTELDDLVAATEAAPVKRNPLSRAEVSFAAASVSDVWALLTDPARMPEWDPAVGRVEDVSAETGVGATWTVIAAETAPDGRPLKVKPERRRSRIELVELEHEFVVEWTQTWPDAPNTNTRRLTIELEAVDGGGTHLLIVLRWERPAGARRSPGFIRQLLAPLYRFALAQQVFHIGASIGRVFR